MPHQLVHRLPRPPRHQRAQLLPRLHVVGQRNRRQVHVPREAEAPDGQTRVSTSTSTTPKARPPAGCGRTCTPNRTNHAGETAGTDFLENLGTPEFNSQLDAHPVRRLPRPRLGLPRRLQAGPPRPTCSTTPATSSTPTAERSPTRWRKGVEFQSPEPDADAPAGRRPGPSEGHPPRKGMQCVDCHFKHGRPRRRQPLRRDPQRRHGRLRRLPRHRSRSRRPSSSYLELKRRARHEGRRKPTWPDAFTGNAAGGRRRTTQADQPQPRHHQNALRAGQEDGKPLPEAARWPRGQGRAARRRPEVATTPRPTAGT